MDLCNINKPLSLIPFDKTITAIEKIQELLKCSQCNNQPQSPQSMGRCDHFFCEPCISKFPNNNCPVCGIPSLPCERNVDSIVGSLVSSCNDLLKLLNGEQININQKGLEAPETVYPFANNNIEINKINNINKKGSQTNSSKSSILVSDSVDDEFKVTNLSKKITKRNKNSPRVKIKNEILINSDLKSTYPKELKTPDTPRVATSSKLDRLMKTPVTPAINKRNTKGETLLHIACIKGNIEKVRNLLNEGANPNTKDNAGWTPLHEACSHGFQEIATLLLQHGALVDVPGNDNETPLHDAVTSGFVDVVRLLRRWGANDTLRDLWGRTPRELAKLCQSPEELCDALNIESDKSLISVKKQEPFPSRMVIIETKLDKQYMKKLEKMTKLLKVKLVNDFSPEVTHVVAACLENNTCQRTVKYMMGVTSGKWILSHKWIDDCLEIGGPANPEKYEISGSRNNSTSGAPSKGRLNSSKMNPGLFKGCHIYLWGSFSEGCPPKKDLEALIKASDGIPLQREPNPESIDAKEQTVPFHTDSDGPLAKCSHYCIYQEGLNEPQLKYDMVHIKSLPLSWLFDCIDHFCLLPPYK